MCAILALAVDGTAQALGGGWQDAAP
jgi:hypothetical protein